MKDINYEPVAIALFDDSEKRYYHPEDRITWDKLDAILKNHYTLTAQSAFKASVQLLKDIRREEAKKIGLSRCFTVEWLTQILKEEK